MTGKRLLNYKNNLKLKNTQNDEKMHIKIIIWTCTPYSRLVYWIELSISQGKKDDMSSKSRPWSLSHSFYIKRVISDSCNILRKLIIWELPTLLCLHAVSAYFAELGSDYSVSTRKVDIAIPSQRHSRRCQHILLIESLYKFCNFLFGHLKQ